LRPLWRQITAAALLGFLLMCAAAVYQLAPPSTLPSAKSEPTLLPITHGSSFKAIAGNLEEAGVIRSALVFEILALIKGERSRLKVESMSFPKACQHQTCWVTSLQAE